MKLTKTEQKHILQELIELDNKGLLSTSYYLMNLLQLLRKVNKMKINLSKQELEMIVDALNSVNGFETYQGDDREIFYELRNRLDDKLTELDEKE
jgi:hypothetical protein